MAIQIEPDNFHEFEVINTTNLYDNTEIAMQTWLSPISDDCMNFEYDNFVLHQNEITAGIRKEIIKYNNYPSFTCIISNNVTSYYGEAWEFLYFTKLIYKNCIRIMNNNPDLNGEILLVVESGCNRGYHLHLVYASHKTMSKGDHFLQKHLINPLIRAMTQFDNELCADTDITAIVKIKSNASFMNYLQKEPLYIISNKNFINMYVNFSKDIIFKPGTISTSYLPNLKEKSPNDCINFFLSCFEEGRRDINDCHRHPNAIYHLSNPNFNKYFDNALAHYNAKRVHRNIINEILFNFKELPISKKCICPVLEYLQYQEIDVDEFCNNMINWLLSRNKRNCILAIGPTNTGKSVFCSNLHKVFRNCNRVQTDSIYSFAYVIGADCAYWEEPFIIPEQVDLFKNVLEGEPDVMVPRKGLPLARIGKKVLWIISTNSELHQYCSKEREPLAARCIRLELKKDVSEYNWCDSSIYNHECIHINSELQKNGTDVTSDTDSSQINKRRRTSVQERDSPVGSECIVQHQHNVLNCGMHRMQPYHMLSFVVYILNRFKSEHTFDLPITDIQQLCTFRLDNPL